MLRDGASVDGGEWGAEPGGAGASAGAGAVSGAGPGARASEDAGHASRFERLHRQLKRIVKARGALDAQEAAALREAHATKMWRHFGCSSLIDYMEREMGYTPRAALERLRVANAIEELPVIADAMDQGSLSFSGARELTRVVTPETQQAWVDAASEKSSRQIEEMVRGHKPGDLPTDAPDPALRTKVLRFEVKLSTAVLERHAKKKLEEERGERLDDDAFVRALFLRVIEGRDEGRDEGSNEKNAKPASSANAGKPDGRSRYQIAVTICSECKRGWHDAGGASAELSPAAVACAECDGQEIGSTHHAGDQVPRAKQKISPRLRLQVFARDRHRCAVPGCRSTNLDAHHIDPLSKGGPNRMSNLFTLCEAHHLALHEGALVLEGVPPNVTFTRRSNNNFKVAARAAETAAALRRLGYKPHEVKAAVEAARTHVGSYDLSLEQWVKIALSKCSSPAS
jgi:hypothetical protein